MLDVSRDLLGGHDVRVQDKLLTIAEVAEALGVSTRSIERFITDGRLRASHIEHVVRIDRGDVIAFIDAGTIRPADKRVRGPRELV